MKKHLLLPVSILISSVLILIGLTTLSNTIQGRPFAETPYIPSSIEVSTGSYLSEWGAINYLRMDDIQFHDLLANGAFDGTYASFESVKQIPDSSETVTGTVYIFSKVKLDDWMNDRIEAKAEALMNELKEKE